LYKGGVKKVKNGRAGKEKTGQVWGGGPDHWKNCGGGKTRTFCSYFKKFTSISGSPIKPYFNTIYW